MLVLVVFQHLTQNIKVLLRVHQYECKSNEMVIWVKILKTQTKVKELH